MLKKSPLFLVFSFLLVLVSLGIVTTVWWFYQGSESYAYRQVLKLQEKYEDITTVESPLWAVSIKIPRDLMTSIERGSIEYAGETIDLQDVEEAEQQNLDQAAVAPEMEEELI